MLKKFILPITLAFSLAFSSVAFAETKFYDDAVKTLKEKDIITGKEDAEGQITRGEYASVLVKALDLDYNGTTNPFSDITSDHKYFDDIMALYEKRVYVGSLDYGVRSAQADDTLTREEAIAFLVRAFELDDYSNGKSLNFSDEATISKWAVKSVEIGVDLGVIAGYPDGTFGPHRLLTRGETYQLTAKALEVEKDHEKVSDKGESGLVITDSEKPGGTNKPTPVKPETANEKAKRRAQEYVLELNKKISEGEFVEEPAGTFVMKITGLNATDLDKVVIANNKIAFSNNYKDVTITLAKADLAEAISENVLVTVGSETVVASEKLVVAKSILDNAWNILDPTSILTVVNNKTAGEAATEAVVTIKVNSVKLNENDTLKVTIGEDVFEYKHEEATVLDTVAALDGKLANENWTVAFTTDTFTFTSKNKGKTEGLVATIDVEKGDASADDGAVGAVVDPVTDGKDAVMAKLESTLTLAATEDIAANGFFKFEVKGTKDGGTEEVLLEGEIRLAKGTKKEAILEEVAKAIKAVVKDFEVEYADPILTFTAKDIKVEPTALEVK